jgi:hypothetical protein
MGELVRQTLDDIMQMSAEDISLGKDSFDSVSVWAEIAEEYGEL